MEEKHLDKRGREEFCPHGAAPQRGPRRSCLNKANLEPNPQADHLKWKRKWKWKPNRRKHKTAKDQVWRQRESWISNWSFCGRYVISYHHHHQKEEPPPPTLNSQKDFFSFLTCHTREAGRVPRPRKPRARPPTSVVSGRGSAEKQAESHAGPPPPQPVTGGRSWLQQFLSSGQWSSEEGQPGKRRT